MDPTGTDQPDMEYLLGVASNVAPPSSSLPGVGAAAAAAAALPVAHPLGAVPPPPPPPPPPPSLSAGGDAGILATTRVDLADDITAEASTNDGANSADASATPHNPKKRPLEDKKARDRKRVLRNRQLARVSNERRKGRIKAMENELTETRQTVTTLEESIRCLEEENRELRNLLQGRPDSAASAVTTSVPPSSVPSAVPPSI